MLDHGTVPLTDLTRPVWRPRHQEDAAADRDEALSKRKDFAPSGKAGFARARLRVVVSSSGQLALLDHIDFQSEQVRSKLLKAKEVKVVQGRTPTGLVVVLVGSMDLALSYPLPVDAATCKLQFSRTRFFMELTLQPPTTPLPEMLFHTAVSNVAQGAEGSELVMAWGWVRLGPQRTH